MVRESCSTREDCPLAEQAAAAAVRKVFAILGVDVDRPESVEEFREDLRFGKRLRRAADHGFLALMGILVAAQATPIHSEIKMVAGETVTGSGTAGDPWGPA